MPTIDYSALALRVYDRLRSREKDGPAQLHNQICQTAIHATIETLKEYERLQAHSQSEQ